MIAFFICALLADIFNAKTPSGKDAKKNSFCAFHWASLRFQKFGSYKLVASLTKACCSNW